MINLSHDVSKMIKTGIRDKSKTLICSILMTYFYCTLKFIKTCYYVFRITYLVLLIKFVYIIRDIRC